MKKFFQVLGVLAVIGGAIAGGYVLYQKYKEKFSSDDDFDEFDDFEDFDTDFAEAEADRGYTSLNTEADESVADVEVDTTLDDNEAIEQ